MKTCLWVMLCAFTFVVFPVEASAQKSQKKDAGAPATIKDVLTQHVGKMTSLGEVKKVAGDYFVVEYDGAVSTHPISAIHTIKVVKDEDETRIEIKLIARD